MTGADRTAAYDAGIRAALAHLVDGAAMDPPAAPGSLRHYWWKRGADRTIAALRPIIGART